MTLDGGARVSPHDSTANSYASHSRQRKRRRWDQPPETLVSGGAFMPGTVPMGNVGSLFESSVPSPGAMPGVGGLHWIDPLVGSGIYRSCIARFSPSNVYGAMLPPQTLLAGGPIPCYEHTANHDQANGLMLSTVSMVDISASAGTVHGVIPSQGTLAQPRGSVNCGQVQSNFVGYPQPLVRRGTSYSGYGDIYPPAIPLYQVAPAFKQSSSVTPAVAITPSTANTMPKPSGNSGSVEKWHAQRQKFQRLPFSSNGPSSTHKVASDPDLQQSEDGGLNVIRKNSALILTVSDKSSNESGHVILASSGKENASDILNFVPISMPAIHLRKKLLVLDINGLLADIVSPPPQDCVSDITIARRAIFRRPYYLEFLQFCFERFEVGLWSSRTKKNIDRVVDFLMGDMKDLSHCTPTQFKTLENQHKPLVFKELRRVWEKHDPKLPWERGYFNESNTLLIDDSPYKALLNPDHTAIFPRPFQFGNPNDDCLGERGDLRVYLQELAEADSIQKFVAEHPLGQEAINEKSGTWDFYRHVICSLSSPCVA